MSRLAVRGAIASYLNAAQITCVGQVFPARPIILSESAYEQRMLDGALSQVTTSNGSGCVLVVNITDDHRERMADTGYNYVNDMNKRSISVELWFACVGDPENGAAAQGDYDNIVDGIFIAIRADPTLGTANQPPASIWQAAAYPPYISHEQSAPYTLDEGLTVFIKGVARFEAWTQDVGAGGTI
jgi:hypothetical protein